MGEQFEAPDRAHRQRERVGDRGFVPAPLLERVDAAPDIDAVHRGADQVFREGLHRAVGFVAIGDDHLDGGEAGCDRSAYAAGPGLDDEFAVLLDDDGRLNDADRLDRGEQLLFHSCRRRGDPGIVRVGLQQQRANFAEFRHDGSFCLGSCSPCRSGIPLSAAASRRPGQGRSRQRRAGAPSRAGPLRRPSVMRHLPSCLLLQNRLERVFIGSACATRTPDACPKLIPELFGAGGCLAATWVWWRGSVAQYLSITITQ